MIPKDKSSKIPPKHIKAICILTPEIQSNITIIFSRSSNAHNSGDNDPKSNKAHDIANNPLNILVISSNVIRIKLTL
jgi:hypothetical protein